MMNRFYLLISLTIFIGQAMAQNNITFNSATELAEKIRTRQMSSNDIVSAFIQQIESYNATYNAVVTLNKEDALKKSIQADSALAKGEIWGKLHGVPITIKDNYKTEGLLTTAGYEPLKDNIPSEDADIVKLLESEGAIIIGKTNLSVLAMDMQTNNSIFGKTNNPWDISKTSGGSSGGCATALATGMTPLSFGNDLAGSIRLPANYCGVYGFKPSYGVVPFRGVQTDPADKVNGIRTMACAGPLARTIDDLELALNIIANSTIEFNRLIPLTESSDSTDIKNLRIAWTDEFGGVDVDEEIKQKIAEFADRLKTAGATVTKISPDIDFYQVWQAWGSIVGMQGAYKVSNFSRKMGSFFTKGVLKEVPMHQNIVKSTSVEKYMIASSFQDSVITQLENFLNDYDVWICPVSATTAFDHQLPSKSYGNFNIYNDPLIVNDKEVHYYMATQAYTSPFNFTESPVLAMPLGLTSHKLPTGIQVIGKRYEDYKLISIGKVLSEYSDGLNYPLEVQ